MPEPHGHIANRPSSARQASGIGTGIGAGPAARALRDTGASALQAGARPGGPRIALIAPRNMRFSPASATSIDLYIHEIACNSRYASSITVFAQRMEHPFEDVAVRFWDDVQDFDRWSASLREAEPDCVVVHQHLPTAARLARAFAPLPVALVRHNFTKRARNLISSWRKHRQIDTLAGIAFVSQCCRTVFGTEWPDVSVPLYVTPNGIDQGLWRPGEKAQEVVFVGRLAPEKGVLQAAEAVARVLPGRPGWRGRFILDTKAAEPRYRDRVMAALAPAGDRIEVLQNLPHGAVRQHMARAAIALAPTQNAEPFGRVAIEALASGAALIASRAGGFVEIVDDAGVLLETPSTENLALALDRLIGAPDLVARLGAAGPRRIAGRYDLASAAEAFDLMVESLTGMPEARADRT